MSYIPDPTRDLSRIVDMLRTKHPFCFVRFSDGEIEILRNRYLSIRNGLTNFQGIISKNNFPAYDDKEFIPSEHKQIRLDLLKAAEARIDDYYKGVPSTHNNAVADRDLLVELNGGMSETITFADLLMNSNYKRYREEVVPLFTSFQSIYILANYRAKFSGIIRHAIHIKIPDNFFSNYENERSRIISQLHIIPKKAMVLSSASSLSNIVGHQLFKARPDLTFIDIGTSINDILGLDSKTRSYHHSYHGLKRFFPIKRYPSNHWIKW